MMALADSKRRPASLETVGETYDDGHLRIEHDNYYLALGGQSVLLARKEFLIISRLARTPGRIVTLEELWRAAWDTGQPLNSESLHVHIYRLRRKLAHRGLNIETMVGVGYRLAVTKGQI